MPTDPFALQLAGLWEAADRWNELGSPYEAALALADGDEAAQRRAHRGARAAGRAPRGRNRGRRLRELGVRVPRGPSRDAREPAGLTRA